MGPLMSEPAAPQPVNGTSPAPEPVAYFLDDDGRLVRRAWSEQHGRYVDPDETGS